MTDHPETKAPPPLCVDCAHHSIGMIRGECYTYSGNSCRARIGLITGEEIIGACWNERRSEDAQKGVHPPGPCGYAGLLFKPKSPAKSPPKRA
jgi:hypothetical protein